ncbi:GNAT family N-acetyltransferase [Pseudomonas rubra]|uniref:GNAT family N-acetyltransferase n=1 Tax=Pseudomonas rubra TaxID=2942627 RepID=A0ABT5P9F7_9PSED|nr:GNAT family N-acetyltransferase [Pseudomonas rubra]MDD1014930.1 GNAT family N-acetyltransferase [Pseudomonas rubra]MDD1155298.1 GNAT family N-acetyltransferase [Pseudomonas rubra]
MPALHHFLTPPAEPIKSQILQMVVDNLTDISSVALPPSNPLYSLYQYGIGFEVHLYLQAMDGSRGMPVELVVAMDLDDPEQVTGFLLYLPLQDDPEACSVAYLAVQAGQRRQGIARAMLAQVTARYPHAALGCVASKVPVFEALGFQVTGARGPQVLMSTRSEPSAGIAAVLDVAPIYRTLEVQQIHSYLLKQHGKRAMVDAEKQRDRHLDQLSRKAHALAVERLGEGPWLEGNRGVRLV